MTINRQNIKIKKSSEEFKGKAKFRYKIEVKNSELKERHRYDVASYAGLQGAMAIFAVNHKRNYDITERSRVSNTKEKGNISFKIERNVTFFNLDTLTNFKNVGFQWPQSDMSQNWRCLLLLHLKQSLFSP